MILSQTLTHPALWRAGSSLVCGKSGRVGERAVGYEQPPVAGPEPVSPGGAPRCTLGARARTSKEGSGRMPHQGRLVGIDVSKLKVDACICSLQQRLSRTSTPQGQQEMIAWLRQNQVGLAVMEARGGYERGWAMALREAGIAVRIVDPKRGALFRPI